MKLTRTHHWVIGILTTFLLVVGGSVYLGFRDYHRESDALARAVVADLRAAGPLYAVQAPRTADEVVSQVQIDTVRGRAVSGTLTRSSGESSVTTTWPGGTPETCRPAKGHDRDYSGDIDPAGDAVMYTSCVRLSRDAVLTLRSHQPPSSAGTYRVFYVDLLVRFGTATASVGIDPDDMTLTRAQVVADARRVLPELHPLDLGSYSDAELLRAARAEVDLDRMF